MPRPVSPDALTASLTRHLERVTRRRARRGLPAPQVRVEAPGFLFRWGDEHLPFHSASVGKIGTAALIAQEVAKGTITFDTPVADVLDADELRGLFRGPGATIAHLLGHTSGVTDYFDGRTTGGSNLRTLVQREPDRHWDAADLLAFTREHQRPVGAPGERFHYSDTGYVLLGRVLEQVTGRDAFELTRERIFEPAGMTDSVVWKREPGPERIAPCWVDRTEASGFESVTVEWMSGGYVTTTDDLARLGTALTNGTLVDPELWERMRAPRNTMRPGIGYGLGVMELRFEGFSPLMRGLPRPVGHLGVLGAHMFVDTEHGTNVVLGFHGTREMRASFVTHITIAHGLSRLG